MRLDSPSARSNQDIAARDREECGARARQHLAVRSRTLPARNFLQSEQDALAPVRFHLLAKRQRERFGGDSKLGPRVHLPSFARVANSSAIRLRLTGCALVLTERNVESHFLAQRHKRKLP